MSSAYEVRGVDFADIADFPNSAVFNKTRFRRRLTHVEFGATPRTKFDLYATRPTVVNNQAITKLTLGYQCVGAVMPRRVIFTFLGQILG